MFWNEFLAIFGVDRRRIAYFEQRAKRSTTGNTRSIYFFWSGTLVVEQKSLGSDLDAAEGQAFDYLDDVSAQDFPHLVVVCDFERLRVRDFVRGGNSVTFPLIDLPKEIDRFGVPAGYRRRDFTLAHETEATVNAAQLMGRLYDELSKSGYEGDDSTVLMTRLLFLMFGDDRSRCSGLGAFATDDFVWGVDRVRLLSCRPIKFAIQKFERLMRYPPLVGTYGCQ
jgi:hypothetical protein